MLPIENGREQQLDENYKKMGLECVWWAVENCLYSSVLLIWFFFLPSQMRIKFWASHYTSGLCLVTVLLLWTHTTTMATFIRTTFNWGWLTGSEVQSIIIKTGTWQYPGRHDTGGAENSTSSSEAASRILASRQLELGYQSPPKSDTPWWSHQDHTF